MSGLLKMSWMGLLTVIGLSEYHGIFTPQPDTRYRVFRMSTEAPPCPAKSTRTDWSAMADRVLGGGQITEDEARQVLACPDDELLALIDAAYRVRLEHFGKRVQMYFLMNAKSGLCPEDCSYCSQSKVSDAEIPKYNLLSRDKLLSGAKMAADSGACTYCIVISARGPSEREIKAVEEIVPQIKAEHDLKICACLGLLTDEHAQRLAAAGVDRVNHNLNTSSRYYEKICTTHTHADRVATLESVRDAGMEICSGGIVGMGEEPGDVVEMAVQLRGLGVHSIPVNFLNSIEGTPLEIQDELDPRYCLKVLAMFRLTNPDREIRIAGGRELHLRSLQPMGLYLANSIFVGDYLTTEGQPPKADYDMITDLGFEPVVNELSLGDATASEAAAAS